MTLGCLPTLLATVALAGSLVPISGYIDQPEQPLQTPDPTPTLAPTPVPPRVTDRPGREVSGKASWHATGRDGFYAAACYPLRKAMGIDWRGRDVLVSVGRRAVEVRLNDWCGSHDKTIDLSDEAFRYFAPLSRGVLRVTVGW